MDKSRKQSSKPGSASNEELKKLRKELKKSQKHALYLTMAGWFLVLVGIYALFSGFYVKHNLINPDISVVEDQNMMKYDCAYYHDSIVCCPQIGAIIESDANKTFSRKINQDCYKISEDTRWNSLI